MGKAEATRAALLDAAVKVIGKKGYAAASVDEIAEAAGVSKGVVYYHFKTKGDIATNILVTGFEDMIESFDQLTQEATNAPEALVMILRQFAHTLFAQREFARFALTELWREDRVWSDEMRAQEETLVSLIASQIERGKQEGALREEIDASFYAISIIGTVLSVAQYYLMEDASQGEEYFTFHIMDYVRHAISRDPLGDPYALAKMSDTSALSS